jgi:hypothetical protein
MRRLAVVVAFAAVGLLPVTTGAWGVEVHRLITRRAIDALPPALQPIYAPYRAFVVEHSVDPDEWRVAGLRGEMGLEDPNHFFEIATMGVPEPFTGVPRDWPTLVSRFGVDRADKIGRLPYRIVDMYGRLVTHFKGITAGTAYAADNARYISAVIAHYLEDANQPLHIAENYDGQLTDQRGLHSRFETQLTTRSWSQLHLRSVRIDAVPDVETYVFAQIVKSNSYVQVIVEADKRASAGLQRDANNRLVYDDGFYDRFLRDMQPVLEDRLSSSADAVASVIVAAWTEAGHPIPK